MKRTGADDNHYEATDSAMLINAMIKRPFPPISLPARQFMENAKSIWEELGLPPLKPEMPWYGYSLASGRRNSRSKPSGRLGANTGRRARS